MADLIEGISYKQLRRVSDWQMTQEAQRAALAAVVHAISRLDTTIYCGEGRTSASDGQRFALPRRILQQTYSTCFSDFALEFYTFLADNYAPFHSMPIECTDRNAAFVLEAFSTTKARRPKNLFGKPKTTSRELAELQLWVSWQRRSRTR